MSWPSALVMVMFSRWRTAQPSQASVTSYPMVPRAAITSLLLALSSVSLYSALCASSGAGTDPAGGGGALLAAIAAWPWQMTVRSSAPIVAGRGMKDSPERIATNGQGRIAALRKVAPPPKEGIGGCSATRDLGRRLGRCGGRCGRLRRHLRFG